VSTRVEVHLIEDPAIERQIQGVISALIERLKITAALELWHGWDAKALAQTLAGHYEYHMGPTTAAHIVMNGLLNPSDLEDPTLWKSPLGRALAFWGCGEPASVPWQCAAAALGCTRSNISLMVRKGELSEPVETEETATHRRITTASLAHAMRSRNPLGG